MHRSTHQTVPDYVAGLLYDGGADVIFHTAGRSGVGVLEAAASELAANHLWAIGVDTDEWQTASTRHRPHILTSIVKRFDEQIYTAIEDHLDGGLEPGARRLTVADEMITYSLSGDALSPDARAELDRAIQRLASGEIQPPRRPDRSAHRAGVQLEPGTGTGYLRRCRSRSDRHVQLAGRLGTSDGDSVSSRTLTRGRLKWSGRVGVGFFDVGNVFADPCRARLADPPVGPTVDDLVSALADLPGDATAAIDITVDGFDGKADRVHGPRLHPRPRLRHVLSLAVRRQQRRPVPGYLGRRAPTSTTECGSSTSTAPGS